MEKQGKELMYHLREDCSSWAPVPVLVNLIPSCFSALERLKWVVVAPWENPTTEARLLNFVDSDRIEVRVELEM